MIIYVTTNLVNNKKYIGKDEKNNSSYLGSGLQLSHAIKKYGVENFKKEVLDWGKDKEHLKNLEKYYIALYNAQKSGEYYNIAPGGTGGKIALNYEYRERPVYEIDKTTYKILGSYKSSKDAHIKTGLNYKCLNAVCNKAKKYVKNRIFVFQDEYVCILKEIKIPYGQKYLHLSLNTGIYYYRLFDLYQAEFSYFKSFSAFKNKVFRNKEEFKNKFIAERI